MRRSLAVILTAVLAAAGWLALTGCRQTTPEQSVSAKAPRYHCPMHPAIVRDKPGECPICGMKLVPMAEPQGESVPAKKKTMYRSTMNPGEVSDQPGKDSMGMEMVPFEVAGTAAAPGPNGLAAVSIAPETRQLMGLTTGPVVKRTLAREIRTSARIVVDETRLYHVTLKVDGWVEHLHEIVTGKLVQKGEPLLQIYSPDLVSAQQEYLVALKAARALDAGADETARQGAHRLVESARQRMLLWDVPEDLIARLGSTGEVEKNLTLRAPFTGWVLERNIAAGHKLMAGEPLLVLADLTQIWAEADIYESDLPYVKVGMPVELTLPSGADRTFPATVAFVTPTLDPETRTVKARLDIANPGLLLKPNMFATARLSYSLGETLAIPEAAVMRTGEHTYAFKDAGDGRLVPVKIQIGPRSGGYFQVLAGLAEGDPVVTSANFLVDSESNMKAALTALGGEAPAEPHPPGSASSKPGP